MKDPEGLWQRVVEIVEEEFFDAAFLEGDWVGIRDESSGRYAAAGSVEEREEILAGLVAAPGVSHSVLITPSIRREIEEKTADPRRLRPEWRMIGSTLFASVRSTKVRTTTREDLEAVASELRGATDLVLDLRLNDGGSGARAAGIASLFLPPGVPVLRVRDRMGKSLERPRVVTSIPDDENADHGRELAILKEDHFVEYRTPERPGEPFPGPIVVLTGSRCYSCGEVLAQAMKEHTGATLVGTRTAGAVVAANEHELPEGYGLVFPFAEMESGAGAVLEGRGVEPDIEVDLTEFEDVEVLSRLASVGLRPGGGAS